MYLLEDAFWDFATSSLVDIDGRFRGAYCLNRDNILEESHFHTRRRENLKSVKQ
jgi:hypothetical protein